MGHLYGFGSTEEPYRLLTLGCRARGSPHEPPFNHSTGRGFVKVHKGHYDDALKNKRSKVVLALVEAFGGVNRTLGGYAHSLGKRAHGRGATDRTKYGGVRASPRVFRVHHLQQVSKAAVVYDARAILKQVIGTKQRALDAAAGVAGGTRA